MSPGGDTLKKSREKQKINPMITIPERQTFMIATQSSFNNDGIKSPAFQGKSIQSLNEMVIVKNHPSPTRK